jgi:DNA-binding transcriptional ArsR family regulator
MGGSVWKALSDDSRRHILLLLKEKNMYPSEIAEHFDMTLAAISTHLRILKHADLVTEKREGQKRLYIVNPEGTSEIKDFFEKMWSNSLNSLKEYVENVEIKNRKRSRRSRK